MPIDLINFKEIVLKSPVPGKEKNVEIRVENYSQIDFTFGFNYFIDTIYA